MNRSFVFALLLALSPSIGAASPLPGFAVEGDRLVCRDSGRHVRLQRKLYPPFWRDGLPPSPGRKSVQAAIDDGAAAVFEYDVRGASITVYDANTCAKRFQTAIPGHEVLGPIHISTYGVLALYVLQEPQSKDDEYTPSGEVVFIKSTGEIAFTAGPYGVGSQPRDNFVFSKNPAYGYLDIDGVLLFNLAKSTFHHYHEGPGPGPIKISIGETGKVDIKRRQGIRYNNKLYSEESLQNSSEESVRAQREGSPIFETVYAHQL